MRISLNWLKDYVKIDLPLDRLIDRLNMIGLLVEDWQEVGEDVILDIETYANRPDTLGHMGVSREIAACLDLPLKKQEWPVSEGEEKTSSLIDIQIKNPKLCPRYCGIIVKDIQVKTSPPWLLNRIEAMGLKPVNNVVDVTNYVLFSTAHPIHAFDLDTIGGKKIIIRKAERGERLKSLIGEDIALSPDMLVIADAERPVALAGVMGGEESSVTERTRNVFIESAYFDPVSIRKTSKKTALSTDASYRFERNADISFPPEAALMAASLLTQMGGKATRGVMDVYPRPRRGRTLVLRNQRITELLGITVESQFVLRTLSALGFGIREEKAGLYQVKSPFFRVDIEREADLIEEIARFYGYDRIPAQIPPLQEMEPPVDLKKRKIDKLRQVLFHQGYDEFVNFSFSDPEKEAQFQTTRKAIEIRNPISVRSSRLRTTLIPGLLENVLWNRNRGAEGIHAFEIGNIYFLEKKKCREQLHLTLISAGKVGFPQWQEREEVMDFFHLKGTCEFLMSHLRYEPFSFQEDNHPFFEDGYALRLDYKGERVGCLGLLNKKILESYSLTDEVWAAELDLGFLLQKEEQVFGYVPVAKFPSITRDVSFFADHHLSYQAMKEAIEDLALANLETFFLYDLFSGPSVPKGKVSLSVRFVFRHPQRTLKAEEVDRVLEKIIKTLGERFFFQLREGGKIDK